MPQLLVLCKFAMNLIFNNLLRMFLKVVRTVSRCRWWCSCYISASSDHLVAFWLMANIFMTNKHLWQTFMTNKHLWQTYLLQTNKYRPSYWTLRLCYVEICCSVHCQNCSELRCQCIGGKTLSFNFIIWP